MMCTQFIRESKPVTLRWGYWHLQCFLDAIATETTEIRESYFAMDGYEFTCAHEFIDELDGEILQILPGDSIHVWRDR